MIFRSSEGAAFWIEIHFARLAHIELVLKERIIGTEGDVEKHTSIEIGRFRSLLEHRGNGGLTTH
jgi:hypothetical protein